MRDNSPTPSIAVTIGGQVRVYYAYVTTAGPQHDGPTTMTLYASTLTDPAGFAADPIVHERVGGNSECRSFALLRPIGGRSAGERIRELVIQTYAEHEQGCDFVTPATGQGMSVVVKITPNEASERRRSQRHVSGAPVRGQWKRRSFALLRSIADVSAQNRFRDLVLEAFAEHEERSAVASKS